MRLSNHGRSVMKGASARRSLFRETLWNYEKMRVVGFSFSIYPAVKKTAPRIGGAKSGLKSQLESINTNPFTAPCSCA